MNSFLVCFFALSLVFGGISAMECGAFSCPNVFNKIGTAVTGQDEGKSFCCRTDSLSVPYCCDAGDYAKYAINQVFSSAESTSKFATATTIAAILLARLL